MNNDIIMIAHFSHLRKIVYIYETWKTWIFCFIHIKWRRKRVLNSKVGKKDLVEFDKVETFDTLEKAKLGTANAPTACRTSIQCIFYYFPLFIMTAFYLFSVLPEMVIILVILYLSTLIIKRYKASKYYSFENNTAPLRRKMDYLVKCIISREYFKETRTLGAFPRLFAILKDSVAKYGQEKNRVEKKS